MAGFWKSLKVGLKVFAGRMILGRKREIQDDFKVFDLATKLPIQCIFKCASFILDQLIFTKIL